MRAADHVSTDYGFFAGEIDLSRDLFSADSDPVGFRSKARRQRISRNIFAVLALLMASYSPSYAGPPFITDDPEPVDLDHWEVYGFTAGTHVQGDTGGTLGGIEVNYGAAPNLQLHVIAPLAFDSPTGGPMQVGAGDLELGAKYRFITPGEDDWWPQVGAFPLIEVPTGDANRGLGSGETREFIPIWLQKDFGGWTTYGGGGFWHNPGFGNQDYWFVGWLLQYQVTKSLALGTEIFHQTADTVGGRDTTSFNVGGIYDFNEHYHLLFSGGRGLQNAALANQFSYYLAIQSTF
jgi:hypothetical protein